MINKKIKDLIKKNPEPARGTVGVNPSDPWSAKANIAEDSSLNQYLLAKGINPKFVSRETKISHAKSGTYQKWKNDRKFEEVETEETLVEDALLDKFLLSRGINPEHLPTNIKVSYSKSGAFIKWKQDHIHEETKTTTHTPTQIKKHDLDKSKNVHKEIRTGGMERSLHGEAKTIQGTALDKFRQAAAERAKKHAEIEKKQSKDGSGMSSAIDRLQAHLNKEETVIGDIPNSHPANLEFRSRIEKEGHPLLRNSYRKYAQKEHELRHEVAKKHKVNPEHLNPWSDEDIKKFHSVSKSIDEEQINELKQSTLSSYKDKSTASLKNAQANRDASEHGKHMSKGFADLHKKSDDIAKKRVKGLKGYLQRKIGMKPTSEDVFQDPQAATQSVFDGGNNTDDTSDKKKQMSKSARMIKSLYKKHNMKEDTYDWEKDDKNQTSYGKKPKMMKDDEKSPTTKQPEARAVLTGGTTLTGDARDTLEIDPMMKNRPDLNGNMKDKIGDNSKKKNKINN
jgi:hypothetical protein